MTSVRRARVEVSGDVVGDLSSPERPEPSVFVYREGVPERSAVSVTMPVSEASYAFDGVHPIFAQNLPEGYLGDIIRKHVAKLYGSGDLTVLAALGRHLSPRNTAGKGCARYSGLYCSHGPCAMAMLI